MTLQRPAAVKKALQIPVPGASSVPGAGRGPASPGKQAVQLAGPWRDSSGRGAGGSAARPPASGRGRGWSPETRSIPRPRVQPACVPPALHGCLLGLQLDRPGLQGWKMGPSPEVRCRGQPSGGFCSPPWVRDGKDVYALETGIPGV